MREFLAALALLVTAFVVVVGVMLLVWFDIGTAYELFEIVGIAAGAAGTIWLISYLERGNR